MSSVSIPEVKDALRPDQVTVQNLLIENGQLIETTAEYQRMGRIEEATKYQERLHSNLIYLAKIADSAYSSHLLQEIGVASPAQDLPVEPSQPAEANSPVAPQNAIVFVPTPNSGISSQQQPVTAAAVSHTSPPNNHQLHNNPTTPPAPMAAQYQFPFPTQSSPHLQTSATGTTQQQQQQPSTHHYPQQQPTVPFQRNLSVTPHSILYQHPQHPQHSHQQQQMAAQQHSIIYATGHAIPAQGHQQQYSSYPLIQQPPQPTQFPHSAQPQFPLMIHPAAGPYPPVVISTQNDSTPMAIRQHPQTYQSYGNHSIMQQQHGTSPVGYMPQQK